MLHPQIFAKVLRCFKKRESHGDKISMDWSLREKLQETPHSSWENRWFPRGFPLSQSIEGCVERMLKNKYLKWRSLEKWMAITSKCALDRNW